MIIKDKHLESTPPKMLKERTRKNTSWRVRENRRYEPTGQAPAGIPPQGMRNLPEEIKSSKKNIKSSKRQKFLSSDKDRLKESSNAPNSHFFIEPKKSRPYTINEVRISKDDLMEMLFKEPPIFDDPLMVSRIKGQRDKLILLFEDGSPLKAINVAKQLHCDIQEVEQLRIKNQLLGVSVGQQEYLYPRFQFEGSKVLQGLKDVLETLKGFSSWTQLMFLKTGDIRLDGKTPLEVLQEGDIHKVVAAAKCYGAHSAA
jgi:hypothetical protein